MALFGAMTAGSAVTTATSWDPRQPQIVGVPGSVPSVLYGVLEANSQTFKAGCLVYITSGTVAVAAEGGPIAGIALKDATNVTSGNVEIPILVAYPGTEWEINVSNGSGVVENSNTTAVVGGVYDIEVTNGSVTLASDDSTGAQFVVLKHILDTNGSNTPKALVRQIVSESQAHSG